MTTREAFERSLPRRLRHGRDARGLGRRARSKAPAKSRSREVEGSKSRTSGKHRGVAAGCPNFRPARSCLAFRLLDSRLLAFRPLDSVTVGSSASPVRLVGSSELQLLQLAIIDELE